MSKFKKCFIVLLLGVFTIVGYFSPTVIANNADHQDEATKTQMEFSSIDLAGHSVSNVVEKMKLIQEISSPVILETEKYLSDNFYQNTLDEMTMLLAKLGVPFDSENVVFSDAQFICYLDVLDSSKAILVWEVVMVDSQNDVWISITVDDVTGQILSLFINDLSGSLELSISMDRFDTILQSYMEYLVVDGYSVSSTESSQIMKGDLSDPDNLVNSKNFEIEINKEGNICIINAAYSENGFYFNYNK